MKDREKVQTIPAAASRPDFPGASAAGARAGTLVATAGGLAQSAALAAADPLARTARAGFGSGPDSWV